MRQGPNQRRPRPARSNGKRTFSHGPNRSYESNGPNVKLRGTAVQIYDKYLALARDATSSGEGIAAENYFQHAEHYFRMMNAAAEQQRPEAAARPEQGQRNEPGPRRDGDGERRPRRGNGQDRAGGGTSETAAAEAAPASEPKGTPPDETVN